MSGDDRPKGKTVEIMHPYLLVVEGSDEIYFFEAYFSFLINSSPEEWKGLENIQLLSTDSNSKLQGFLEILPDLVNINILRKMAIIQDADNDETATFISIQHNLQAAHLPVPSEQLKKVRGEINDTQTIEVQILLSGLGGKGMLEDLCLESVSDDPAMPCVDSYFKCLEKLYSDSCLIRPKNISKSKTRVFVASRKECTAHVGYASKEGYWNFNNHCFDKFKVLLKDLITDC